MLLVGIGFFMPVSTISRSRSTPAPKQNTSTTTLMCQSFRQNQGDSPTPLSDRHDQPGSDQCLAPRKAAAFDFGSMVRLEVAVSAIRNTLKIPFE